MPPKACVDNLLSVLRTCRREGKSSSRRLLFMSTALLQLCGSDGHECVVGNELVPMLVQAGCLRNAHILFERLLLPSHTSWISLILGYVNCGDPAVALILYENMSHLFSHTNCYVFIALLKACGQLNDLESGSELHAEISRRGLLDEHLILGNTLIGMYIKCGSLSRAKTVFEKLSTRDVVTWTTLIGGCAERELCLEALEYFERMLWEGVSPNEVTFVCVLKACGSVGDLDKGRKIHAQISTKKGELERGLLVGCALIDMYVKCGCLTRAFSVSNNLFARDVVSWTTLITGYVKHGHAEEALLVYEKMQLDNVTSNSVTLVACLKACGMIQNLGKGKEMYMEVMKKGLLETDLNIGNALIDMYAKCGQLKKARKVFDRLPVRDVISWNALVTGYMKWEDGKEVLNCYENMQFQGISPDPVTYLCCLKACGAIGAGDKGRELHAEIARKGLLPIKGLLNKDLCLSKALIDMYATCGLFANAMDVFEELPVKDMVAWTTLIAGYAKHENGEEALRCFKQMKLEGISPDRVTYFSILKACGSIETAKNVEAIYSEISTNGFLEDISIGNAVLDMYSRRGALLKVQEVFDNLVCRDIISWTSLISGYAKYDQCKEALHYFERMQLEGYSPDSAMVLCLLKACGNFGAIEKGVEIHALIDRKGLLQSKLEVGNALINMYAKCGMIVKAQEVFDRLPVHDVISWTTLIAGYAELEKSDYAFHVFNRMREEGEKPDDITFLSVMTVCSHLGLVSKGEKYFEEMSKEYGIIPTSEHLSCLINLFSRAGDLRRVISLMKEIPDSRAMCHILLDGSLRWGNIEFGKQVFDQYVLNAKLQP